MFKKMLAAPLLGLLFVVFMPIVGFILAISAIGEVFFKGAMATAERLEKWATF